MAAWLLSVVALGPIFLLATGALAGAGLTFAILGKARASKGKSSALPRQLRAVRRSGFSTRPVVIDEELDWLTVLDAVTDTLDRGHRVLVGVGMERLVGPQVQNTKDVAVVRAALRSRLVDYVITDSRGTPLVAVDLANGGPRSETQALRHAIGDEALRRAGIRLIEIGPEQTDTEVAEYIYEVIDEIDTRPVAAQ